MLVNFTKNCKWNLIKHKIFETAKLKKYSKNQFYLSNFILFIYFCVLKKKRLSLVENKLMCAKWLYKIVKIFIQFLVLIAKWIFQSLNCIQLPWQKFTDAGCKNMLLLLLSINLHTVSLNNPLSGFLLISCGFKTKFSSRPLWINIFFILSG